MTIHRPEMSEAEYRDKVSELRAFMANQGASNQETDPWGKRKFAYSIDHVSEGSSRNLPPLTPSAGYWLWPMMCYVLKSSVLKHEPGP